MGEVQITIFGVMTKWNVIQHHPSGKPQLVVRVKNASGMTTVTLIPYKKYKWKLFNCIHTLYLRIKYYK